MTFVLSLLLFFVLVRVVLPRVLRVLLGGFVRQQVHKAQRQGGFGGFPPPPPPTPARPPGQVRVEYVPPKAQEASQSSFKGGEYVDYEEA